MRKEHFDWPGLGRIPPHPGVSGLGDLAELFLTSTGDGPVDPVAQSMGGVVAMLVALARPKLMRRVVWTPTAAGMISSFSPEDWCSEYAEEFPAAAPWILTERPTCPGGSRR